MALKSTKEPRLPSNGSWQTLLGEVADSSLLFCPVRELAGRRHDCSLGLRGETDASGTIFPCQFLGYQGHLAMKASYISL